MPTFRTKGIIIKKNEVREADRIFTILTDNLGKIKIYGRSIGKVNSKLGGHVDLFTNVDFVLARGKSMPTMVYAKTIDNFMNVKSNLKKTGIAFYTGELLDNFLLEDYKDSRIYRLLYYFLTSLNVANIEDLVDTKILFWSFELKLLDLLGYLSDFTNCLKCKNKINKDNNYFGYSSGGFICSNCIEDEQVHSMAADREIVCLLNCIYKNGLKDLISLKVNHKQGLAIKEIIDKYILFLANKEMRSSDFLDKINYLERQFDV